MLNDPFDLGPEYFGNSCEFFYKTKNVEIPVSHFDELNPIKKNAWIQLYSGKKFSLLDPQPEDITIEDIAHGLSNLCRFTGQCKKFYSVAQHSVLVSLVCGNNSLHGLLHDASEAIISDISSPLKRLDAFAEYKVIEKRIQSMIYHKFGLLENEPINIKKADLKMLATEARDLLVPLHPEWKVSEEAYPFKIMPMGTKKSKKLFLDRFKELYENS